LADDPNSEQGTIRPTRLSALALIFVVGGLLGWLLVPFSVAVNGVAPRIEWSSVGALVLIAALLLALANWMYRMVHKERRKVDAQRAVSFLLLAKASSVVGSVMAGGYTGFALHFVDQINVDLPRERVVHSVSAALAAVAIVIAGLLLERACRVPKDSDDDAPR
jgi:high-affinity Fe2+/Pb2+ permease